MSSTLIHDSDDIDTLNSQQDNVVKETVKVSKKRGRKPLHEKTESSSGQSIDTTKPSTSKKNNSSSNEVFISTKNGTVNNKNIKKNDVVVSKPIIVHLNVTHNNNISPDNSKLELINSTPNKNEKSCSFESNFFEYTPQIDEPIGYDGKSYSSISEFHDSSLNLEKDNIKKDSTLAFIDKSEKKHHNKNVLMKDFIINEDWAERTNYWCYWDCHPFESPPFGIPIKYKDGKFHVYGCFCSLECAVAYNFYNVQQNIDNAWENYNLINMLSNVISYKTSVNPAIDRRCLQSFGGNLTIEDFRHLSQSNTSYNVLSFPMVSVVEHVEEVTDLSSNNKTMINCSSNSYFPLDKSIINKLENNQNNSNVKSTLEKSMKMTFFM